MTSHRTDAQKLADAIGRVREIGRFQDGGCPSDLFPPPEPEPLATVTALGAANSQAEPK